MKQFKWKGLECFGFWMSGGLHEMGADGINILIKKGNTLLVCSWLKPSNDKITNFRLSATKVVVDKYQVGNQIDI